MPRDENAYTIAKLEYDVHRTSLAPEKARRRVEEVRDLFGLLLEPISDAARARIINKLRRRLILGFGNIEHYAALGKIAIDPEVEVQRQKEREERRLQRDRNFEKSLEFPERIDGK